jgi:hypothetical protein
MRQEELKLIFTAKKYLGEEWKQLKKKSDELEECLTSDIAKKETYNDRIRKYHARIRPQINRALSCAPPDELTKRGDKKGEISSSAQTHHPLNNQETDGDSGHPDAFQEDKKEKLRHIFTQYLGLSWDNQDSANQLPTSNGMEKAETTKEEADKEGVQNKETNRDDIAVVRRISLDLEAPKKPNMPQSDKQHEQREDRSSCKNQYYNYSYETFKSPFTNDQIARGEVIKLYQASDKYVHPDEKRHVGIHSHFCRISYCSYHN